MREGLIGYIDTPAQGNKRPDGVMWCADNGCFSDKWEWRKWWTFLVNNADHADSCLFAVAPDVVGDAEATLERATPWLAQIRDLGYRVAYVAQNGLTIEATPWDACDALFLGGSLECLPCGYVYREMRKPERYEPCPSCGRLLTEWKLGAAARDLAAEAKRRGKWLHGGRCNSQRRFRYFEEILGCDSADGTYLTRGADMNLPKLLSWTRLANQGHLFAGWSA